jgi:hypothetical protein
MTLTKCSLKKLGESMQIRFTKEQECVILERFGDEPWPYEWSEQDIVEQVLKIVRDYSSPVKPLPDFI